MMSARIGSPGKTFMLQDDAAGHQVAMRDALDSGHPIHGLVSLQNAAGSSLFRESDKRFPNVGISRALLVTQRFDKIVAHL